MRRSRMVLAVDPRISFKVTVEPACTSCGRQAFVNVVWRKALIWRTNFTCRTLDVVLEARHSWARSFSVLVWRGEMGPLAPTFSFLRSCVFVKAASGVCGISGVEPDTSTNLALQVWHRDSVSPLYHTVFSKPRPLAIACSLEQQLSRAWVADPNFQQLGLLIFQHGTVQLLHGWPQTRKERGWKSSNSNRRNLPPDRDRVGDAYATASTVLQRGGVWQPVRCYHDYRWEACTKSSAAASTYVPKNFYLSSFISSHFYLLHPLDKADRSHLGTYRRHDCAISYAAGRLGKIQPRIRQCATLILWWKKHKGEEHQFEQSETTGWATSGHGRGLVGTSQKSCREWAETCMKYLPSEGYPRTERCHPLSDGILAILRTMSICSTIGWSCRCWWRRVTSARSYALEDVLAEKS